MAMLTRLLRPRNTEIITSEGLDRLLRSVTPAWSGIGVTPKNALEVAAVFACVRVIAEDIGKLPFPVYAKSQDGEKERATSSPYWKLVHDAPNAWQSSQEFREYLTACALLRGNGFALKRGAPGQVRELLPLPPEMVRIEQLPDFEVVYHVTMADGHEETLGRRDVFHLRGLSMDGGVSGISVVGLARQTIGSAMALERHAGRFFANGMQPGGVFEHPGTLSDAALAHLKASLKEEYAGENAFNTLVLEEGMKFHGVSLTHEDSQFLESRQFTVPEICRWFRVPPHKVHDLTRSTFSNIEHQSIEYVTDTLMPWGVRWDNAYNRQVIGTNAVVAELLFEGLLRGTTRERYQAYQVAVGGPWMSRNEARRRENLPPVAGLDDVLQPLNTTPAGEMPAQEDEDGPDDGAPAAEDRPRDR